MSTICPSNQVPADTVTAEGSLKGKPLRTVVNAIEFDADHGLFTATRIDQGHVTPRRTTPPRALAPTWAVGVHGVQSG